MKDLKNTGNPVSASQAAPRTWDFWETLLVALIATAAYLLTGGLALSFLLAASGAARTLSPAEVQALWLHEQWQSSGVFFGGPASIGVLWIAIRMARRGFAEYLALNWPSAGEVIRALSIMTMILAIELFVTAKLNVPTSPVQRTIVAGGVVGLIVWFVGTCVGAPIIEELLFRGFIFRGWSQSFLGPVGTIVLASAIWAMQHTQYDWYSRFCLFISGLAFGHFRARTGSTWLPVIAHSAMNIFVLFITPVSV
ncbi:type II CAAX endopeptidase family protein [Bradyrhizobium sp. CIAT3101]|uniref:CPBP family intramembrane glutamic endopeptidase n=1 Tax=Bradyrhizobium sp. CIAT3101 TaxID=439387 RepID=UPI0024B194E3|nr:type II CAAX endopeptidase family protein [Bradyrhizobium sp. CIAT3101]WFU84754.1 type II CAAX endopeptidase family protein [Bradyrhizobium sp. CIAT3101]